MTGWLLAGMSLIMALPLYAQQGGNFVYDSHGKRDPFGPMVSSAGVVLVYDSDLTAADMALEGILADKEGKNLAIISGKVVKAGEQIGPWQVETIAADHVDLVKDGERVALKLKKGGT